LQDREGDRGAHVGPASDDPESDDPASAGPASVRSVAQVFVENLSDCAPGEADVHHLTKVLRLRPGETVVVSDGRGRWRACDYTGAAPWLEPRGEIREVARAEPPVTVGFVPVKGERPEWVVQKLVEIGVDRIVVLRSSRSVVVWEGGRARTAVERLEKVATQAAAQSRRAWLAAVEGVIGIEEFASREKIVLAELGGGQPAVGSPVCVGPEGGWSPEELSLASGTVGLGDAVLRAETAAVVGAALVCALRDQRITTKPHL
jgi:16S rRNA (uracil1498-N3)-methyltransferase